MPSRKGMEQAMTWLRSKAMDRDSLDGINAELVLNVIADLQRQNKQKGCVINQMKTTLREETKDRGAWEDQVYPMYPRI